MRAPRCSVLGWGGARLGGGASGSVVPGDVEEGDVEEVCDAFAQGGCPDKGACLDGLAAAGAAEPQQFFVLVHGLEVPFHGGGVVECEGGGSHGLCGILLCCVW